MDAKIEKEVKRYAMNLFAFPDDYFETHSAKDLNISEEARQTLMAMKAKKRR